MSMATILIIRMPVRLTGITVRIGLRVACSSARARGTTAGVARIMAADTMAAASMAVADTTDTAR